MEIVENGKIYRVTPAQEEKRTEIDPRQKAIHVVALKRELEQLLKNKQINDARILKIQEAIDEDETILAQIPKEEEKEVKEGIQAPEELLTGDE